MDDGAILLRWGRLRERAGDMRTIRNPVLVLLHLISI